MEMVQKITSFYSSEHLDMARLIPQSTAYHEAEVAFKLGWAVAEILNLKLCSEHPQMRVRRGRAAPEASAKPSDKHRNCVYDSKSLTTAEEASILLAMNHSAFAFYRNSAFNAAACAAAAARRASR
jgi:hypothetical protein